MGGKKKLGIKQMEKQQDDKAAEEKKSDKKADKKGPPTRKANISIIAPDAKDPKVVAEVKKLGVLTPYAVASRYSIRISAAKDFLEQLEANGAITQVSGSHNLKIYKAEA
ncbi:hypothetical protein GX563_00580 [Candidatus Bathyarchaeota archaeon]|nr:hypothetical protein [Candidatus Bathyarchaeota archaeon]